MAKEDLTFSECQQSLIAWMNSDKVREKDIPNLVDFLQKYETHSFPLSEVTDYIEQQKLLKNKQDELIKKLQESHQAMEEAALTMEDARDRQAIFSKRNIRRAVKVIIPLLVAGALLALIWPMVPGW